MKYLIVIIVIFQIFVVSHLIYFTNWVSYNEHCWKYNITKIGIDSPLISILDSVYPIKNTEQKDGTVVYTTDKNCIRLLNSSCMWILNIK